MKNSCRLWLSTFLLLAVVSSFGCATGNSTDWGPVFYPPPPQRPRIQFLTSISGAEDVEEPANLLMTFLVGNLTANRRFRKPTSIAAHAGVIYVADPGWDTVLVLDLNERTFESIGDRGMGKLQVPVAVTVDASGNKFVADSGRNQVVQFNERNEFVRAYGNPETLKPTGVAVNDEFIYVVNRKKHRIEVYDRLSKQRVLDFGGYGTREGQFNIPTSLSRRDDGHLFVTDSANFRIQEFDDQGGFIRAYGFLGDGPGTFARPRGSAVDQDGHLYVTDAAFENVQIWDTDNAQVLLAFGGSGVAPGNLYLPGSVHIDYELVDYFRDYVDSDFDLEYVVLVVSNYGPHKISIYGFVSPKDASAYPVYALPDEESNP
jgi:hypothetical protein